MTGTCDALWAPYLDAGPRIMGPPAYAGPGAAVLGRARIGKGAWLGACAVIRADGHDVRIGDDFHLGAHGTVHIAHAVYPTDVGHRVAAGRDAVIHACEIGDDCLLEAGAVVLDGSVVGPGAVIAAGSVVFPRSTLEGGWLYAGCPAKPVAPVTAAELEARQRKLRHDGGGPACDAVQGGRPDLDAWVAPSAVLSGDVRVGREVGIWYGCRLDAGTGRIVIGDGSNVQDNTSLVCAGDGAEIGADVTIGHNVRLGDCRIGDRSLIGIASTVAPGTEVEGDVLLAAGAETEPGQRLTAGRVWAGRPARPIAEMDDRRRAMMAAIPPTYRDYARTFRSATHENITENWGV